MVDAFVVLRELDVVRAFHVVDDGKLTVLRQVRSSSIELPMEEARDLRLSRRDVGRLLQHVALTRKEVGLGDEAGDGISRSDDRATTCDLPDLVLLALAHVDRTVGASHRDRGTRNALVGLRLAEERLALPRR